MNNASEGGSVLRKKNTEMDQTQLVKEAKIGKKQSNRKQKKMQQQGQRDRNRGGKRYELLTFQELPEYMKDNEYILNYYRADWPIKQALFSIFRWHNETLNVWTHLIGFILFLGLTIVNLMHVPQVVDFFNILSWSFPSTVGQNVSHNSVLGTPNFLDLKHATLVQMNAPPEFPVAQWPFFVFLAGSMSCLLSSSVCHLFSCHSHHLNLRLLRMDYAGITVMIITSFFPPIYYIFQCDPLWQLIYLGGITIMGMFTIITLLSPVLSTGKFRGYRAFLFVAMGLFGLIPAIHAVIVNWSEPQRNVTLAYETAMALSYLIGTMFYVTRIPERWKPGWFDLAGHSHQIFHVLVIMGALAHYGAAHVFMEFRGRVGCQL